MLIIEAFVSVFVWAFYSLSALALGYAIASRYEYLRSDKIALFGLSIALGLGLFGTFWSALILIPNGFNVLTVLPVLLAPFFLVRREIKPSACEAWRFLKTLHWRKFLLEDRKLTLILAPLAMYLAISLLTTLNPLGTDARAFYFPQAKLIAYNQSFIQLSGYFDFGQIPLPAELNYAALMTIGFDFGARMISVNYLLSCVLLIFSLTLHCSRNMTAAFFAVFLLLSVRRQSILDTAHKNIRCASGSLV